MASPSDPTGCTGLSWTIDAWGNRTDQTVTGGTCNTFHQAVNPNNQLVGTPYQYDAAGNLLTDGNHSYTFDAENHLTQVDGGSTASYVYDADGRRARKTVGTNTTDYLYDLSDNIFAIFGAPGCGGTGCWNAGAVYLNGYFFTEYYNGTTYFRTTDHLDSARLLIDLNQAVFDSFDFLPFGEQTAGANGTLLKFTGQERDSETGNDNFGARYYGSGLGRFLSPDPNNDGASPYSPQSWNAYSYVGNSPLNSIDPDGLCGEQVSSLVEGTSTGPPVTSFAGCNDQFTSFTWRVLWSNVGQFAQHTNDVLHVAYDFWRSTPNAGCVAGMTLAGTVAGASVGEAGGTALGGALGAGGGALLAAPTGEAASPVTVPLGAAGGAAIGGPIGAGVGGVAGGVIGWSAGQVACRAGTGGGGGSGSGGSGTSGGLKNKLNHVFDPKHNLGSLVKKFGGEENAWAAIQKAGAEQLSGSCVANGARATIDVGGETVTVTGYNSPSGYVVGNAWK